MRRPEWTSIVLAAGWVLSLGAGPIEAGEVEDREAIRAHVEEHAKDGKYRVYDPRAGKSLKLELESVHETAHPVASGEIFYCADFRDAEGNLYDLDFYVDRDPEGPRVVESLVHKANGKDRLRPKGDEAEVSEDFAKDVRGALKQAWAKPRTLHDPRQDQQLELTLDHVHSEVKALPDGNYFACVDARDQDGVLYDIDVYVEPVGGSMFRMLEFIIHKRDGKERLR